MFKWLQNLFKPDHYVCWGYIQGKTESRWSGKVVSRWYIKFYESESGRRWITSDIHANTSVMEDVWKSSRAVPDGLFLQTHDVDKPLKTYYMDPQLFR